MTLECLDCGSHSTEQWRAVPGYPGYEVSNLGNVRSFRRSGGNDRTARIVSEPRPIKAPVGKHGYRIVYPSIDHKAYARKVANLVALAFLGPREPGMVVRHLDGDQTHDHLGNLSYGTRSDNTQDSLRHGTQSGVAKTHCKHGHSLSPENTWRYPSPTGGVWRICKTCRRERERRKASA